MRAGGAFAQRVEMFRRGVLSGEAACEEDVCPWACVGTV